MTRYRLGATVDLAGLSAVLTSIAAAGERHGMDPEITLSLMPKLEPAPSEGAGVVEWPPVPAAKRRRAKRQDGAEWPSEGSIYAIVLGAVKEGKKTPHELQEVLKAANFSAGSVNSALGRLEKANKVQRDSNGSWIAAGT